MKHLIALTLSLIAISTVAQDFVKKRIVSQDGIPLPYSTVRLLPGNEGVIANEDGFFVLSNDKLQTAETVRISHLGYKSLDILPSQLSGIPLVTLEQVANELSQVNILADSDKEWAETIYEAFQKRRNAAMNQSLSGKLTVRSYLKNEPIEILEGEGVVSIDETGVPEELKFSYVQTNIDTASELQFFNVHTSTLISRFAPFERLEVSPWPLHPGRLGKKSIYKDFKIELVNYNHETGISEFKLTPESPEYLSALIWLDEEKNDILRYEIFGENFRELPIESIIKGRSIEDFSMRLTFDFGSESKRLNYLLWDYSFDYGNRGRIHTLVKMPLDEGRTELPVFIHDRSYHDYAMAAILPEPAEGISKEMAASRSIRDLKALENLEKGGSSINVGLIFWDGNKPLDINRIPDNTKYRKDAFESSGRPSRTAGAGTKFQLSFNSVIYKAGNSFSDRSFFDSANSAIPKMEDREVGLLINLLFDEYHFAAQRISTSATNQNLQELTRSERDELELRKDRLLMNSTGGADLRYLLERNFANYELHGIDRFYQLNEKAMNSPLFARFNQHLNPTIKEDMAFAFLLIGDYTKALREMKTISDPNAQALYLLAMIHYFSGDCEKFKTYISQASEAGYVIPDQAAAFCL
jgi:hypothetical protein